MSDDRRLTFPMNDFIIALYHMTPEQRLAASAERASERYGIPIERCQWWINEAKLCNEVWPIRGGKK